MGVYYLTSQPYEWSRFGMLLLINVLAALVSQSLGLLVGAVFDVEVIKCVSVFINVFLKAILSKKVFLTFFCLYIYLYILYAASFATTANIIIMIYDSHKEYLVA